MKSRSNKKTQKAEPTPEARMIDFTRRLLNVPKAEVDTLRRKGGNSKKQR